MKTETIQKINQKISDIGRACEAFANGLIGNNDIKKVTAPAGIYEQKNSKFMMRIRVPGGQLSLNEAKKIINIISKYQIEKLHITTRQDLQLHDVDICKIPKIAKDFLEIEMPFYGGGGDTFRNITACPHSGFCNESAFDVVAHAKKLSSFLMDYEKAFDLPRKFKIAFSCCQEDYSMAKFTDLGFIAKFADGKKGFEVHSGGGVGKESCVGIKISDFIPETDIFPYAIAGINFFHQHGNRNNRSKARLRFLLIEKGEDFFRQEFTKYLELLKNLQVPEYKFENTVYKDGALARLFIPHGNLNASQFTKIINMAEECGAEFLRFSQEQDLFVGPISEQAKIQFRNSLPELNGQRINGLIKSCVGASICKIGLLDASKHAQAVSEKLSDILSSMTDEKRNNAIEMISASIKISGCQNSCGGNKTAKYGFQGCRRNIAGVLKDFYLFQRDGSKKDSKLSENTGIEIPAEDIPDFIIKLINEEV
ncbi:MAG: nitrite/sulfite reductase [Candidatus Nanoarchaeia archaeon]